MMKEYFIELYRLYEKRNNSKFSQIQWENAIISFVFGAFIGIAFAALTIWALIIATKVVLTIFGAVLGLLVFVWLAVKIPVFIGKHFAAKEEN